MAMMLGCTRTRPASLMRGSFPARSGRWAGALAPWLVAFTACGNAGTGTGPVDGSGTACDTETPPATSGGSHGPPFEFADEGADETGGGGMTVEPASYPRR